MKFQTPESDQHVYVIALDTMCDGHTADKDENGDIILYTKEVAEEEIADMLEMENSNLREEGEEEVEECDYFMEHKDEYIENRKLMFGESGAFVTGEKPNE